jgi:hypothetical protein
VSRTAVRQVSFADWELMRQGLRLDPLLQAISDFLDDQKDMIEQVRCDLIRGLKNAETGRSGMTPQQILRSLVLMRIKNWDYRELRERIADGCTLRQFTDFYCLPVPRHDAFHRGFTRLTSETLRSSNDLVVQAAGGRSKAACRHHGGADRHSSSDRQIVAGCRSRRYAPDRLPCRSAGTPSLQGVSRSDAIGSLPKRAYWKCSIAKTMRFIPWRRRNTLIK